MSRLTRRLAIVWVPAALVASGFFVALATHTAAAEPGLPPAWTGSWKPSTPIYGVGLTLDISIPMSDGVILKASVAYPTDPATGKRATGRFPVLLEQTPYAHVAAQQGWGTQGFQMLSQYFVSRGYIYVSAEVRGTHHSGGEFSLMSDREKQDGAELVRWVSEELESSNGRVGLTGCSYTGLNQYFTAARVGKNSPVKAMAPTGVGPDWYREPALIGGIPTTSVQKAFIDAWSTAGTDSAVRFSLAAVADMKAGGDSAYDGTFWTTRSAANLIPQIVENGIPALIVADWNDYPTSPSEAYAMFQNAAAGRSAWMSMSPDQKVSPRYQLMMRNEQHCAGRAGGALDEALLKWFDTWLKDMNTGLRDTRTTMHLYELGTDRWVSGRIYPQVARYQSYYLNSEGTLTTTKPEGSSEADRIAYALPSAPSATLSYTTPPLIAGAVLAGPVSATMYAKSTTSNILLIAELFDIAPDGAATQLASGALIGSLRELDSTRSWKDAEGRLIRPYHPFTSDEPIAPGAVNTLDIQIQPRQAALRPGHRLRLVLKTQSDPTPCGAMFPGARAFWCLDPTVTQRRALENASFEVQRNGQWSSHLNLPLLPLQGNE